MLNLFNAISREGSPSTKVNLLKGYPYQQELKTILRLATDPFITFGITDFELPPSPLGGWNHYEILDRLANRQLTGGEAKQELGVAVSLMHSDDQEVVRRILRKDLRCGLGEKLVLAAYPGLIRQFDVMRAKKYEKLKRGASYVIEPKYDGLRCLAIVERGCVKLFSRNGLEFTSSDHLKPEVLALSQGQDCIFDGELISGNFNESSSAVRKKHVPNPSTAFIIFDHLDMDEWKSPTKSYRQRRNTLANLFEKGTWSKLRIPPSYDIHTEDGMFKYYNHFLDAGYEGGMVKDTAGLYRLRRHADWQKLKEVNDADILIEGLIQGEGKYHGMLGAIKGRFRGKWISIGTGFSDAERQLWWDHPELIKGKIMEVHYHQITPDGSLRHPRLFCIREDKKKVD